jgi:hypothetical protein
MLQIWIGTILCQVTTGLGAAPLSVTNQVGQFAVIMPYG